VGGFAVGFPRNVEWGDVGHWLWLDAGIQFDKGLFVLFLDLCRFFIGFPRLTIARVRRRNALHEVGGRPQQCDASAESASRQRNTHTPLFLTTFSLTK
jgi:hypothetical protein